ncbi:unnamed protein product [Zymoseptoria tritici ST99CH_1E4]|uniref:AAA+ ATPase domain-containing protein n=1 Tax=Zymoseptoria tritici ST99CH_1E4 TaxID=1276532 RepID=A0A2H1FYP4_ZYMTR|nr:unnamed protein product [Zymoseptoria tritici ST99CH_1E4]
MYTETDKNVHPFFTQLGGKEPHLDDKTRAKPILTGTKPTLEDRTQTAETHGIDSILTGQTDVGHDKPKRTDSKRKPKSEKGSTKPRNQPTLGEMMGTKPLLPQNGAAINTDACDESTKNAGRQKRRRTSQFDSVEVGADDNSGTGVKPPDIALLPNKDRGSPQVQILMSSPLPPLATLENDGPQSKEDEVVVKTPPRKVLRLNANGKFSSPPSKKSNESSEPDSLPSKRRGRPRKAARQAEAVQLLAKLSYGTDDDSRITIGSKINSILHGELEVPIEKQKSPKKRTPQKPARSTHPLFLGKAKAPPALKAESPRKMSAITPGKLRVQTLSDRFPHGLQDVKEPDFISTLLRDRLLVKQPGARDPPFPAKDQVHVRSPATYTVKQPMSNATFDRICHRRKRKRKQARTLVHSHDSVLTTFASQLKTEDDRQVRPDGFHEPSQSLRVPHRRLISGEQMAQEIVKELSVQMPSEVEDELSLSSSERHIHSALHHVYAGLPHTMTAFDLCRGEPLAWTQKHAPVHSAHVLQPRGEIVVLRDWLKSLSVQAVGGAATQVKAGPSKLVEKAVKKKRKKKADDMDDFLVDSDEDLREMTELNEAEVESGTSSTRRAQASIVQTVQGNAKLSNAVLLSGPHGCGKSAAAYAVAKELGFKVFEISSSERRSGRDVLDRVGDLTENHNVRHHGTVQEDISTPAESTQHDEAFQNDLASGRQGKMNAFFQPQAVKKKPAPARVNALNNAQAKPKSTHKKLKAIEELIAKKPQKDQQQSLILLEEVDILFKDDKDFWTTVMKLMITSKRPFIMTCNDEDTVPFQAMVLHAVLRFTQPSPDLAADYLLLVAAAEGHLLRRDPVLALYRHNRSDLRASLVELNYWCQMGVGDPRGGLSWIYQRYPPGLDKDENGRTLRVASVHTYQDRMGFPSCFDVTPEDALLWAWHDLGIEPASALGWGSVDAIDDAGVARPENRRLQLNKLSRFSDALSAADAFSALGLPESAPFDPTLPDLPDKARGHYIEGRTLLQVDESVERFDTASAIYAATILSAYHNFEATVASPEQITKRILAGALSDQQMPVNPEILSRSSFACFDPIATISESALSANPGIFQSVFDGPMCTLALDLAPYVRTIVQYDKALEEQRERLSLLNTDGRASKRARTTRAARSALEGSQRSITRKERWFAKDLDMSAALATGGSDWPRLDHIAPSVTASSRDGTKDDGPPASSAEST